MCGVLGVLQHGLRPCEWQGTLAAMTSRLAHRGPDDSAIWFDAEAGVGLGHRRLAVIDLSESGRQPMHSARGRYCISYNGEVYNSGPLRTELESLGHRFRGTSDTEVVLAAVEHWGLEKAVPRFNGMFAFALWDKASRLLSLVRDRFGIKPLYYGWLGDVLVFGSELRALRAHPAFHREIDRDALTLLMRLGAIPEPYSVFRGVRKQRQGTILHFRTDARGEEPAETVYWSLARVVEAATARRFPGTEAEAVEEVHRLMTDSVRLRVQADVPVGAFLSGGVDSSTIVAMMQEHSARPVKTFTIGFREKEFDEIAFGREVANRLGTDHTELRMEPEDALDVIPLLPAIYDEPFADSSQIPALLISRLARESVTVALVGDGGDEVFGGYRRHSVLLETHRRYRAPLAVLGIPTRLVNAGRGPSGMARHGHPRAWWSPALRGFAPAELFIGPLSRWKAPDRVVLGTTEPPTTLTRCEDWPYLPNFAEQMMYLDTAVYLPDQLLAKLDRASMAVSLEARVPFLDHRLVEFAWSLPLGFKLTSSENKRTLRRVLDRYVPRRLVDRPKMGFSIPLAKWLRGALREWAEELLDERRLEGDGLFNVPLVRRKWASHLDGGLDQRNALWSVLMVQAWLDHEGAAAPRPAPARLSDRDPAGHA